MGQLDLRHRLALELNRKVQRDVIREHPLRQLFWECTLRCNLHCRHCGSDCKATASAKDMPLEDFLPVLRSVKAAGLDSHKIMIVVTGGEPLMRPDLERCGRAFYDLEFAWGMVTNGYALTEKRLQGLLDAGLGSMTISLDGLETEHEWLRGVPGCFARAEKAIRLAAGTPGLVFDVVTCVNRKNFDQLDAIMERLLSCGVKAWRLFTIFPVGRAAEDPDLQLSREQFRGLLEFIKATRREGRIRVSYGCEGFLGNYEGEVRDHFFFCQAGVSVGGVLSDGSISACTSIRSDYHQGNIYEDDFMVVWNSRFQPYRDRSWMKKDACADCKYWRYCRGGGMHLRGEDGKLLFCHLDRLSSGR